MTRQTPELRGPLALFRTSLIVVCGLLSVAPHGHPVGLLVLLPLAIGALAAYRSVAVARVWPYAAALVCAWAVPFTGGGQSALLPYLMASGLTLGLTRGVRDLLIVSASTTLILICGPLVAEIGSTDRYLEGTAQWVFLALAVGLVAVWSRTLHVLPAQGDEYQQVLHLLEQLRSLARHLPGSLDAQAAAESLLRRCSQAVTVERGAVIVQTGEDVFVPLAVLGVSRVPWRTPMAEDGPLRDAWVSGQPVRDSRKVDLAGRRHGSTLLAIPLPSRHGPFALVVLESSEIDAFPENRVTSLSALVVEAAPQLETAIMFEEVRSEASSEERDRLAREMHDGIAQELVVLGYALDQVGVRAAAIDEGLAAELGELRTRVTTVMSELRLSITDLRTTVRPSRGIGAALSTYLPAVCSGREIVLNFSLSDSPFRLPADQEAGLLKAVQTFAQEVRRVEGSRCLNVALTVDPPSAVLLLSCDIPLPNLQMGDIRDSIPPGAGDVSLCLGGTGEPSLTITLKGHDDDNAAPGRRPRTDQARAAQGVRAD